MAQRNLERHAYSALLDVHKAESSWEGWNNDAVKCANDLVNLVLQMRNAQDIIVWHPKLLKAFSDLQEKYLAAMVEQSNNAFKVLEKKVEMMEKQVRRIESAAGTMEKLIPTNNKRFDEPLVFGSLDRYARMVKEVCEIYKRSMDVRRVHMREIREAIDAARNGNGILIESDSQLIKLSIWLHSPGLKDAKISDVSETGSTLTVDDFDDIVRLELGIEEG